MKPIGVRIAPIGTREWGEAKKRTKAQRPVVTCELCGNESVAMRKQQWLCVEHLREYQRQYRVTWRAKQHDTTNIDQLANTTEVANRLRVTSQMATRIIKTGRIGPAKKIRNMWHVSRDRLKLFVPVYRMSKLELEAMVMEKMKDDIPG